MRCSFPYSMNEGIVQCTENVCSHASHLELVRNFSKEISYKKLNTAQTAEVTQYYTFFVDLLQLNIALFVEVTQHDII
jgi:hypothetical protein